MSKQFNLAQKIKAMKIGQSFIVSSERERQNATKAAKTLRDAGVIEFDVITRSEGNGFKIVAI